MNTDFILLKAQLDALRTYFISLLPRIFDDDEAWLPKFLLWQIERDCLLPYALANMPGSPEREMIDRRRYHLQVLMDVAYIHGHLEERDIIRRIDDDAAVRAHYIYELTDRSEQSMIELIDQLDGLECQKSTESAPPTPSSLC